MDGPLWILVAIHIALVAGGYNLILWQIRSFDRVELDLRWVAAGILLVTASLLLAILSVPALAFLRGFI